MYHPLNLNLRTRPAISQARYGATSLYFAVLRPFPPRATCSAALRTVNYPLPPN